MQKQKIKELLESKLEQLSHIHENVSDKDQYIEKDQTSELNELSQSISNNNVVSLIEFRKQKEVANIKKALLRIDSGEFGCCSDCGNDIEDKRLLANPLAILCIDCQETFESRNKKVA